MRGFESDRKWIIEKKNDVAIRAMDNKEKTDQFIEKLVDCLEKCLIYGHIRRFAN